MIQFILYGRTDNMGKTAACIKIIQILSARDIVSANELADILEINPRNIKEYVKELEVVGYSIESVRGINGGYRLNKRDLLPSVALSLEEKDALQEGAEFLNNSGDFLKSDSYNVAMGKIMASFSSKEITPITMIDRFPLSMDKNLLQQRYSILSECIEYQLKCEVTYLPASNQPKKHILHPYKLFVYNGSWFVLAWNEKINDFGYYKLNRIENLEKTKNHFTLLRTYDESHYLDSFGMKQNGDYYHIELELRDLVTVMQERIYGKNQEIKVIDDHYINFSCDMQNKNMILSFVLSFGNKCKVLSPEWLVDMVKDELDKTNSLYD